MSSTEAELTDLRILVANYKELGLTNYLVTILDNLANGDPANQYYTGRKDSNLGNTSRANISILHKKKTMVFYRQRACTSKNGPPLCTRHQDQF